MALASPRATRPSSVEAWRKAALLIAHRKSGARSNFEVLQVGDRIYKWLYLGVILLKIYVLKTEKM